MSAFQSPVLGQYIPTGSVLHRLDPRTKLLFVFGYMFVVFLAQDALAYLFLTVIAAGGVWLSRIPLPMIFRGLKPILWLIALTALLHLGFTKGGDLLLQWGPVTVYEEGVRQAGWMSLRFLLLVVMGTLLTLTTSPIDLTDGLERLLKPLEKLRVPAHELALMMSIALRFLPALWEETEKIIKAQQARGADFETGNLFQRAKSYIPVIIPLFVSAFRRAEELALAMEARCYRGGKGRTRIRQLQFAPRDWGMLVLLAGLTGVLLWLRLNT
ncbi:energy-coupling factor transporter transmembrane protein EcfT [Marinithermofilum abyssi]|uniref:Energy-coupling factor transporter transmembrane protein EcfT n=1 Tax=Marinithermofilum abyssi TaxID=1571185 RepID=A0A8J2VII9_9BACL|nr:energy-coupling factor transporter transmembrane component T [Marinithermofilum abyssi]GGE20747.1 energy-coupling factor transporter transmembrane protein EcfT [Marinithermofilum abyssi]